MTVALDLPVTSPASTPPALRVVPAPICAPPYDDELTGAPVLHLVADPLPLPVHEVDDSVWFTDDRTPAADLPDPEPLVRVLLQGLVEVLAGARSLTQFRMQLDVDLYAELNSRLEGGSRVSGPRPQRSVRSVVVQTRPEGVVEACGTVLRRGRFVAVALRLEGFEGRWVCTVLEGL